jgi:hypothetical protein
MSRTHLHDSRLAPENTRPVPTGRGNVVSAFETTKIKVDTTPDSQAPSSVEGLASTAADVVVAAFKLGRGESIDDRERAALARGRDLLMGVADFSSTAPQGLLMLSGGGTLDALETIRRRAEGNSTEWTRELAGVIDRALDGVLAADDRARLDALQGLFVSFARLAVARGNSAIAHRDDRLRWTGLAGISPS